VIDAVFAQGAEPEAPLFALFINARAPGFLQNSAKKKEAQKGYSHLRYKLIMTYRRQEILTVLHRLKKFDDEPLRPYGSSKRRALKFCVTARPKNRDMVVSRRSFQSVDDCLCHGC